MIMKKMDENLFYNLRHLKTFKSTTNNDDVVWAYRWPDGQDIEVYNRKTGDLLFKIGHDPRFAEYICSLHNMSKKLIKEVESKYAA